MKFFQSITFFLALAIIPLSSNAADPVPAESSPSTKAAKAPKAVPFRGTISAVDATAGTFTIANKDNTKFRVFSVSKTAKLTANDKDITLVDVKAGDYARGAGLKLTDDKFEVNTAKFGPKTAEDEAADKARKEKKAAKKALNTGN